MKNKNGDKSHTNKKKKISVIKESEPGKPKKSNVFTNSSRYKFGVKKNSPVNSLVKRVL